LKKILFDFVTLQVNAIWGGILYTQKIFDEILDKEVEIYGLYDGNMPINERIESITKQCKVTLLNIRDEYIFEIINNLRIDTFFIGIAQSYGSFNLCALKCKVVIVCHDLNDMSLEYFKILNAEPLKIFEEKYLINEISARACLIKKIKFFIKIFLYPLVLLRRYIRQKKFTLPVSRHANLEKLIKQPNVFVVTVSEYSKCSIQYFLGNPKNKIEVFYSPIVNENFDEKIENFSKAEIKGKKYFLMLSVNRACKNAILLLEQWERFCLSTNYEYYFVLVGKQIKVDLKNCIALEEVASEELAFLYKNAFALVFPSFTEGFGYPPIEAAAYSTPSICANVTSIPEICGEMPIYFSPFYPEDLFRAMIKMTENREFYVEKTKARFLEIKQRQKQDLKKIIDFILG